MAFGFRKWEASYPSSYKAYSTNTTGWAGLGVRKQDIVVGQGEVLRIGRPEPESKYNKKRKILDWKYILARKIFYVKNLY
jgi:hypothetical protein